MSPRPTAPIRALIADPDAASRTFAASVLAAAGFRVHMTHGFEEALKIATIRLPMLILADIRLGDYNGLHLVLNVRYVHPQVAAIVTCDERDRALQGEARRTGATFVTKPVTADDLRAAVMRTLWRQPMDVTPIDEPFERRTLQQRRHALPVALDRRGSDRRRNLSLLMYDTSPVM